MQLESHFEYPGLSFFFFIGEGRVLDLPCPYLFKVNRFPRTAEIGGQKNWIYRWDKNESVLGAPATE
jgi:hypothetical protein